MRRSGLLLVLAFILAAICAPTAGWYLLNVLEWHWMMAYLGGIAAGAALLVLFAVLLTLLGL